MVLARLLAEHPEIDEIIPVSSSRPGESLTALDPGLSRMVTGKCGTAEGRTVDVETAADAAPEVVFAALPHLASAKVLGPFYGKAVIIDLSADFRIKDPAVFERAYGQAPPRPDLLDRAVYGLCEVYPDEVRRADLIANPGCYPTASLLPLIPLLRRRLIGGRIIINALSGISGAGKKAKENLLFCERTENTGPYSPGKSHRHTQEIQQELSLVDAAAEGFFTPHLVPLKRGMEITTTVELRDGSSSVAEALHEAYEGCPFVEVREDALPETRNVWGSNRCDIGWYAEGSVLFLFSVIDNLMKGASGQAVQNMNLRFGFDETAGLPVHGEL
jgi:N-acetyl-gamma-glutamyl-phosphate reductase